MYEETTNVPQRETEVSREFGRLHQNTEVLEQVVKQLFIRLQPMLRSGGLKADSSAKTPENSSKFAQDMNGVNRRLDDASSQLKEILNTLEL